MTREDILDAAAQVFRQKGFHGASMADIAGAVKLQKASLYHHVSSKQEILLALLNRALELLLELADPDLVGALGEVAAQVRQGVRLSQELEALRERQEEAQRRLSKKHLELQRVLAWARDRLITSEELKPQLAQVREEMEHWQAEVDGLTRKLQSLEAGSQDARDVEAFCGAVRDISGRGVGVLIAGQHVRRILNLAHRAYLLEAGRITSEGDGRELLASRTLRRALLET